MTSPSDHQLRFDERIKALELQADALQPLLDFRYRGGSLSGEREGGGDPSFKVLIEVAAMGPYELHAFHLLLNSVIELAGDRRKFVRSARVRVISHESAPVVAGGLVVSESQSTEEQPCREGVS